MGTRQAKRLRQIDAAHERYAVTLLAVGLPQVFRPVVTDPADSRYGEYVGEGEPSYNWYDNAWRESVGEFYTASFGTGTPPGPKARKRFVRGYVAWLQKEIRKRSEYEDHTVHGVTGRRRKETAHG